MEHSITFDNIWEAEERQALVMRLSHEYTAWRRGRRRRRAIMATAVVLAGMTLPLLFLTKNQPYDDVCCNRSTFPDSHWADVATNILTIETI